MKNNMVGALFGIGALLTSGMSSAATIQLNPLSQSVNEGGSVQVIIQGANFIDATNGGGFLLNWIPGEVELLTTQAEILTQLDTNWFLTFASVGAGSLDVSAGNLFGPGVTGTFDIVTLEFKGLVAGVTAALGLSAKPSEPWRDANLNVFGTQPDYVSASIDIIPNAGPVPVPGAVWLFGSGLLGLVGIARRREQRAA